MSNRKRDILIIALLTLYFSFSVSWDFRDPFVFSNFIFKFVLISAIFFPIFKFIWNKVLNIFNDKKVEKLQIWEYIVFGIIIVLVLGISMYIFYPTLGNYDSRFAWGDMKNKTFNDWHCFPYILIFSGIPSLFSNDIYSLVVFQTIFVFFTTMYLFIYIRKNYLNFKNTLILLILFVLNPVYIFYSVNVTKDIPYSWCLLIFTIHLINITKNNTKWLKKTRNKFAFLLFSIFVLLFRHNGIIPFVLGYIYILIFIPKIRKFILISFVSIMISFCVIKGPIYKKLNVEPSSYTEVFGVVMQNLSYYYEHAINISEAERLFLDSFTPRWNWVKNYHPRSFNHIKFQDVYDTEFCIDNDNDYCKYNYAEMMKKNTKKILKVWFNLTIKNPNVFLQSFMNVSSPVWEISRGIGEIEYYVWDLGREDKKSWEFGLEIPTDYDYNIMTFESYYKAISSTPLRWFFVTFGQGLFIIFFALLLVIRKTKFELKKLLPFLPVVVNALAIMFLITGEEYRFVYAQGLCFLPLIFYAVFDISNKKDNEHKIKRHKKFIYTFSKMFIIFNKIFLVKTEKTSLQFFRYLFVGGFSALINISLLFVFTELFNIYYLISNVIAFCISLVFNYSATKLIVFQQEVKMDKNKEFLIYALIGITGLFFDSILLKLFTTTLGQHYMISKILSTCCVFVWNFIARKLFYKFIK